MEFHTNIMNKIDNYVHVVFCVEHYNPLGLVRSLGEAGIRPIVIVVNGVNKLVSKSKYIGKLYTVDSIEDGYTILMKINASTDNKYFLYTADDAITSYLDNHFDEVKKRFYFFNAGLNNRVTYYMNKENILQIANKHGLKTLKAIVVNKGIVPPDLEYPIITKSITPIEGGWKNDVFICEDGIELAEAYKKIRSSKVLLQHYIFKKNEYCIEGFSVRNGFDTFLSIASTYNYLINNSYSPYMTVYNFDKKEILDPIKNMIKEIGFEGIFEVEFLVDNDNNLYFSEINFRNSTWSYAATCAGMNLPILWAKGMIDGHIAKYCYKKIEPPFTAMVEINDFSNRVATKKINLIKWLLELKACKCRYYIGKNDFWPVIYLICSKIYKRIKKLNK